MSDKIGIQYQPLSGEIYAGRLSKDETYFLDKQEVTNDVLESVAAWVLHKHDGEVSLNNGVTRLKIKALGEGL